MSNINEKSWEILVLILKQIAIKKFGNNYQNAIIEITGFHQSHLSRMFNLHYQPTLGNFLKISQAVGVNFFIGDKEGTLELDILFEKAMEELGRRPDKLPKN